MDKERVKTILQWAMRNRAEDSFELEYYYWTPQAKRLFNKLTILGGLYGNCLLIGVRGSSGVGKSALLKALRRKLELWVSENKSDKPGWLRRYLSPIFTVKWGEQHKIDSYDNAQSYEAHHSNLIDTPDYGRRDLRKINRDLTQIFNIWNEVRERLHYGTEQDPNVEGYHQRFTGNFVVFLQKELIKPRDHFFLRKMDIVELKSLTTNELLEAFKMRFTTFDPFTGESLTLIAELSRGIFRRFMRYIQLALENMIERGATEVTVDDVKAVITEEILMEDMELEFYDMFKNERYTRHAVRILNFLRDTGQIDQKTIAEELGIHATILGRIVANLEENGYVKRIRGTGKTWQVEIQ